ncbi:MAG: ATPase, T2SS/T4P/T4SS family [Candidatus Sumerlaeota bacterium]|nr:ATPase, T2SS/T4P/T4SS family [Candidatus Sumerlaeota bacterium]
MKLLQALVRLCDTKGASDIHMIEGQPACVRLDGKLVPVPKDGKDIIVTRDDITSVLETLPRQQKQEFEENWDVDFSLNFDKASGRVNVGMSNQGKYSLTMRYLRHVIPNMEDLGIEVSHLLKLASHDRGLVIVAGETGSGKTTTIATILNHINKTRHGKILTTENPVEYIYERDKCLIEQREIGRDVKLFEMALKYALRKNPNAYLLGEVRDAVTARAALEASETGILTFCTIHALNALPAIARLANMVTGDGRMREEDFYLHLSHALRGIIAQRLVQKLGGGRLPIYEIFHVTAVNTVFIADRDYPRLERSLYQETNVHQHRCLHRLLHMDPCPVAFDLQTGGIMADILGDMWKQVYENELKYKEYKMPAIQ